MNTYLSPCFQCLLVSRYSSFTPWQIMSTSLRALVFYEIFNYTIISIVGFSNDIRNIMISGAMTSRPSVKVSRRDAYCELYGGRQVLEFWPHHLFVILTYTDSFEPHLTEVQQSFYLINRCNSNVRLQHDSIFLSFTTHKKFRPLL